MSTALPSGNVGEWSELYVLGFLAVNGGAFAADGRQQRMLEKFYKVLEIYVAGKQPIDEVRYVLHDHEVEIQTASAPPIFVSKSDLDSKLREFFAELTAEDNSRTFTLATGAELLEMLSKRVISASSSQRTSDLELTLEDQTTKLPSPRIAFSIKSQLGSPSTLLNASGATNFVFRVVPPDGLSEVDFPVFEKSAVRANIRALERAGFRFDFVSIDSANFRSNLELVDSNMPANLAKLLIEFYSSTTYSLSEAATIAFPSNEAKSTQQIFKVKQFLAGVAMGLRPSGYWDGDVTKFKGLIVVKVDGDVVFFYLYNLTEFQEFLFNNLKFEVASTTRHKFGDLYKVDGEFFIRLNLQIRFLK